jgi:predicted Zn-dependent peptidase
MPKNFKKITLDNDLRIILVPQPGNLATTFLVLVEAGSKYETKEINGVSHFLEHMCFKGTKKRPKAVELVGILDGIGAEFNAFTSNEWTGFYAKAQAHQFETILDVISDIYLNSIFDKSEIEKEKGVITEEINMYEDMPTHKVQELFIELLYGDQPAGWPIGGKKEIIQKLTRQDIVNYHQKHYISQSTLIVVSGNFKEKEALNKIKNAFKNISTAKKIDKEKIKEEQKQPKTLIKYKESDQTHLVLGCRAFNAFDERRFTLEILANILGGGMSSRLFEKIRNQLGAAYYIHAGVNLFTDHGYFLVASGIDHQKVELVIKTILSELLLTTNKEVSDKELKRAKDNMIGRLILALETSDDLAMFYGGQEILRRQILEPEEILKKIKAVSKENIMIVAKEIFKNSKLNLAVIGPYKDQVPLEKILKF